jgi:hypothetical protein
LLLIHIQSGRNTTEQYKKDYRYGMQTVLCTQLDLLYYICRKKELFPPKKLPKKSGHEVKCGLPLYLLFIIFSLATFGEGGEKEKRRGERDDTFYTE